MPGSHNFMQGWSNGLVVCYTEIYSAMMMYTHPSNEPSLGICIQIFMTARIQYPKVNPSTAAATHGIDDVCPGGRGVAQERGFLAKILRGDESRFLRVERMDWGIPSLRLGWINKG